MEGTYWHPEMKREFPAIMELDNLLLSFVCEALAPPWLRPNARQLAGHPLFEPVSMQEAMLWTGVQLQHCWV